MHSRWNKERLLFVVALLALTAAGTTFLTQQARELPDAEALARVPAVPTLRASVQAGRAAAESPAPRHSPFMPERVIQVPSPEHRLIAQPPEAPPQQPSPVPLHPEVKRDPTPEAVYAYVGVASAAERICALVKGPGGETRRVSEGDRLPMTDLSVWRIEKQQIVLKDTNGRTRLLTHDGLR